MGTREQFVAEQAGALSDLDFLVLTLLSDPPAAIELARHDGQFTVTVASPKLPFNEGQTALLTRLGFTKGADTWSSSAAMADPASAAAMAESVLVEVLATGPEAPVDLDHGSRRPLVEAQRKVEAIRARIAPIMADLLGREPTVDADGDFVLMQDAVEVYVSPLAIPNLPAVIRVFAITNVGLTVTPELGLFLARLNFGLMFGRFALDADHRAVWFSETLLGEAFSDEELRFTIGMVTDTADEWDDRIAQMFGGFTRATLPRDQERPAPAKPGKPGPADQAGYL